MEQQELIPHLFRTEFRKITVVLCKLFGIEHLETAEDLASDTFLSAMETWTYKGVPPNPTAWLYHVAKNKARNHLQRDKQLRDKIIPQLNNRQDGAARDGEAPDFINLFEENNSDSQLQMLFAVCHPSISRESQIALALRILCGFGIDEIANAFLTNRETINKRLHRAKTTLRREKISISVPAEKEIDSRLDTVLATLYLLFNEGYYSESHDQVLREDLCQEAMRLTRLLLGNQQTDLPSVKALYSLTCFQSSRFAARKGSSGELILYEDQDESLWNRDLISAGLYYLHHAATGPTLTKYHLEAAIACWYTQKTDTPEKWENILQLFDTLLQVEYSPVAALNRIYALSKLRGPQVAIEALSRIRSNRNQYYYSLLGELYRHINPELATGHFQQALSLARSAADRQILQRRIRSIAEGV
ncbi:RNA polymerase sigma factor [Flavihumibacter stibioxidans]|uniref:RNA polymerase subunit sigma n=1 Tax=Flavihumibacter stibioxidans TaxID=1834163 RepID=A0ABR7M7P8_9BACT|nr:sigma-70 family RNA polymerase sigma factor [Flavihumibacter stibioxidans]MBC6491058.1 RNA polymerase subunit sigma [Flavihumibacter stibioxidans]